MIVLAFVQMASADVPVWWQRLAEAAGLRPRGADPQPTIEAFDPAEKTAPLTARLRLPCRAWDGLERASLLIIGPDALTGSEPMPGDIEKFAAAGGKVLILAQDPVWVAEFVGLEPSPQSCLRAGPGDLDQEITRGLLPAALGGWPSPLAKSPIRTPDRGGWRSLLNAIDEPGFTILMEMSYGWGRITWCAIDFDLAIGHEPAMVLARRVIDYAARPSGPETPSWRSDRDANRRLFDPAPSKAAAQVGFYLRPPAAR